MIVKMKMNMVTDRPAVPDNQDRTARAGQSGLAELDRQDRNNVFACLQGLQTSKNLTLYLSLSLRALQESRWYFRKKAYDSRKKNCQTRLTVNPKGGVQRQHCLNFFQFYVDMELFTTKRLALYRIDACFIFLSCGLFLTCRGEDKE